MFRVAELDDDLKAKILECLYGNELLNIHMIHSFENEPDRTGHTYLELMDDKIVSILQIQFDGNSNFTNFYTTKLDGLKAVARQIKESEYKNQLVAGKRTDVVCIFEAVGNPRPIEKSYFYRLNQEKSGRINIRSNVGLRKINEGDPVDNVKAYLIDFFGADSSEAITNLTSDEKISDMQKKGLYILYDGDISIGMARFLGFSRSYVCVTTVYIDPKYRSKGYGKRLIAFMIEEAYKMDKTPVLEVHADNKSAIRIYEELGFEIEFEYAFEFVDRGESHDPNCHSI